MHWWVRVVVACGMVVGVQVGVVLEVGVGVELAGWLMSEFVVG